MRPGHGARGPRCAARAVPALRWPERADLEAEPAELAGFALPEPRWPLRWLASERAHFEVEICWPLEAAVRMMPWAILLALELCYVLCGNLLDASVTIDVTFNDDAIVGLAEPLGLAELLGRAELLGLAARGAPARVPRGARSPWHAELTSLAAELMASRSWRWRASRASRRSRRPRRWSRRSRRRRSSWRSPSSQRESYG